MNLGWLLRLYFLEDRFVIILFKIFKLGFVLTKSRGFKGISMIIGIFKLELQVNLSLVKTINLKYREYETGNT